jgi:putative hydroxymethylpyrimidine transport system substrate-binding protein
MRALRHLLPSLNIAVALLSLAAAQPARAADHLTVLLDWFVNPNHGPLVIAQAIGAYQRAGLAVSFIEPADPTMPPRLVASGHGEIALDYQPQLYQQVANGLPLMRIGALIDRPLDTLVALKGRGIAKIADLRGKRIGYNEVGGAVNLAELRRMLQTGGLTMADVTLVNVGTSLTTALLTHQVDAVGVDRNFEPFELADKGAPTIGFDYEKFGVPTSENLVMVVRRGSEHDARYPRFLAAVKEGAAYIRAHPEDAWKLFIRAYPNANNRLNHDAWTATLPYFAADPAALDSAKYDRFAAFLTAEKVIKAPPTLATYALQLK